MPSGQGPEAATPSRLSGRESHGLEWVSLLTKPTRGFQFRSRDVPCDFCSPMKLKAVKSCLQCMAALCDNHIRSHYEDRTFKNHQLIAPLADLKANMCLKHRRLLELFCKMEGKFICQICLREEHKNHEAVSLKEDRKKKEVSIVPTSYIHPLRSGTILGGDATKSTEVPGQCVMKELKRLQTKVMDFIDQEERSALVEMGHSIQHRQEQMADLRKQNLWLATLVGDPSDHQFLQVMLTVSFLFIWRTYTPPHSHQPFDSSLFFFFHKAAYCVLNFDASTANEELFLFEETHSVLNLGILLENYSKPSQGFNHWPQLLCSRSLCEGCHYWEAEIANAWLSLGVTYNYRHRTEKTCMLHLIGRNGNSWCLEWDSVKFSVWHDNVQTVVQGDFYKTIGVLLDYAAGSLTFYGVTSTMNLIYRFLTTFTEPLYPAAMVSKGNMHTEPPAPTT
uniref:Uncharacterized protein n=1 Tax=Varanus komodoensis TaxID=61221 RepID=A0A8D2LCW9_VARKO